MYDIINDYPIYDIKTELKLPQNTIGK